MTDHISIVFDSNSYNEVKGIFHNHHNANIFTANLIIQSFYLYNTHICNICHNIITYTETDALNNNLFIYMCDDNWDHYIFNKNINTNHIWEVCSNCYTNNISCPLNCKLINNKDYVRNNINNIIKNKNIYYCQSYYTKDSHPYIEKYKKNESILKNKIVELELKPPGLPGTLYQFAENDFNSNRNSLIKKI